MIVWKWHGDPRPEARQLTGLNWPGKIILEEFGVSFGAGQKVHAISDRICRAPQKVSLSFGEDPKADS